MPKKLKVCKFGERLLGIIQHKNLDTQAAFAKKTGISDQTLSNYLTGKSQPKLDFLEKVVELFSIDGTWLLTGQGGMVGSKGRFKEVSSDAFARGNVQPDMILRDDDSNVVVVEAKQHGPVTLAVASIEQAHLAMDPDATEPEIMELILRSLDNRLQKIAPRYGSRISAREPSLHEDRADYPNKTAEDDQMVNLQGDACDIDRKEGKDTVISMTTPRGNRIPAQATKSKD
jgi:transcriptional regulator with XRE-family HTH domain